LHDATKLEAGGVAEGIPEKPTAAQTEDVGREAETTIEGTKQS
jgi:hypothetical protein